MTALARHFFPGEDLDSLSDIEFAQRVNEAKWLRDHLNPFGSIQGNKS